jgi:hypothetical protein
MRTSSATPATELLIKLDISHPRQTLSTLSLRDDRSAGLVLTKEVSFDVTPTSRKKGGPSGGAV